MTITHLALTNARDYQKMTAGDDEVEARHGQFGRKSYVPYGLYVFEHENPFDNAPSLMLFDTIKINRKEDIKIVRDAGDYKVTIAPLNIEEITLQEVVSMKS